MVTGHVQDEKAPWSEFFLRPKLVMLIKAMFNAKGLGVDNAKVIGRYLIIDNQKYDFSTIPTNLK